MSWRMFTSIRVVYFKFTASLEEIHELIDREDRFVKVTLFQKTK